MSKHALMLPNNLLCEIRAYCVKHYCARVVRSGVKLFN